MRGAALLACALLWLCAVTGGQQTSCQARCGDPSGGGAPQLNCGCDAGCGAREDCCGDYEEVCFTCQNRCSDSRVDGAPCQCHSGCHQEGNCCEDREEICEAPAPPSPLSDEALRELTEELWRIDGGGLREKVELSLQERTTPEATDDVAPFPLFTSVDDTVFKNDIVKKFLALQDNYHKEVTEEEVDTPTSRQERSDFLDAVVATGVMGRLEGALRQYGFMKDNESLKETLEDLWFSPYPRYGNIYGSSGFEHVFFGELEDGTVGGFHNWLVFYRAEAEDTLNYEGYIEYEDAGDAGLVLTSRFTWLGSAKPIGGGTIAISVELELALDTLCFLARPDAACRVATAGHAYDIQTFRMRLADGRHVVASAYPVVLSGGSPLVAVWGTVAAAAAALCSTAVRGV